MANDDDSILLFARSSGFWKESFRTTGQELTSISNSSSLLDSESSFRIARTLRFSFTSHTMRTQTLLRARSTYRKKIAMLGVKRTTYRRQTSFVNDSDRMIGVKVFFLFHKRQHHRLTATVSTNKGVTTTARCQGTRRTPTTRRGINQKQKKLSLDTTTYFYTSRERFVRPLVSVFAIIPTKP